MKFAAAVLAIATAANAISLQAQSDKDVEALKVLIPDILAKREAVDAALADVLDKIQNICGCDPDDESCIAACNSDRCGVPGRPCEAIKDLSDADEKDSDDDTIAVKDLQLLEDFDDGVTAVKDLARVEDKDSDDDVVAIKDLEDLADFDDGVVAVKDLDRLEDKDSDDDVVAVKDLEDLADFDDGVTAVKDLRRVEDKDDDVIAIKDLPDADEADDDIIVIADLARLKH